MYLECDGFRESQGNAKYLLSLSDDDGVGSLLSSTRFWWFEWSKISGLNIDFTPFVFFGMSGSDEHWAMQLKKPHDIIVYHHHMGTDYTVVDGDLFQLYRSDQANYAAVQKPKSTL